LKEKRCRSWVRRLMPIIPATWKVEIQRMAIPTSPDKKVQETPYQWEKKLGVAVHACHSYYGGKCKMGES
jgi:hypothetical protein